MRKMGKLIPKRKINLRQKKLNGTILHLRAGAEAKKRLTIALTKSTPTRSPAKMMTKSIASIRKVRMR
jgi:hypothetical protein